MSDCIRKTLLLLGILSLSVQAQFHQEIIGYALPDIRSDLDKANQSKVFWHQGSWWGVLRSKSLATWNMFEFTGDNWEMRNATGSTGDDSPDAHIDSDANKLYLSFSLKKMFSRMTYTNGSFTLDSGFPKLVDIDATGNDPASLVKAVDGDLFIFYNRSGVLYGLHSTDDGVTWTSRFAIAGNINSALTDAVGFRQGSTNYIGLLSGEGSGDKKFRFFVLADSDDPTIATNWTEETLPVAGDGDDHVCIVKDLQHNLYAIVKLGGATPGVTFRMYHRNTSGAWSSYNVATEFPGNSTRPVIAVDQTNQRVYLVAVVGNNIRYTSLDMNNLRDVQHNDWQVIIKNSTDIFNNTTLSYQPHNGGGELMLLAENDTRAEAWYNTVSLPYQPQFNLLITEVNSVGSSGNGASYVEIFNYSRSSVNLGDYRLRYYNNGSSSATSTLNLSGNLPPLGYAVITNDASAFQNAYGFAADFEASGFPFDGGEDAILLLRSSTYVDGFNNGTNRKINWSAGQNFQRSNYPNDGRNLFFAYRNGATGSGTPGEKNILPLLKGDSLLTGIGIDGYRDLENLPDALALYDAYPNPFNPQTTVYFQLNETAPVRVDIYAMDGRLVKRLHSGLLFPGEHRFQWQGDDQRNNRVSSGVYIVQVHTPRQRQSQRVMLVR